MSRSSNLAINVRLSNAYRTLMIHWIRFRHDRFHYLEENSIFFDFKIFPRYLNTHMLHTTYTYECTTYGLTHEYTTLFACHCKCPPTMRPAWWHSFDYTGRLNGEPQQRLNLIASIRMESCLPALMNFCFSIKRNSPPHSWVLSTPNDRLAVGLSLQAISGRPVWSKESLMERVFPKDSTEDIATDSLHKEANESWTRSLDIGNVNMLSGWLSQLQVPGPAKCGWSALIGIFQLRCRFKSNLPNLGHTLETTFQWKIFTELFSDVSELNIPGRIH